MANFLSVADMIAIQRQGNYREKSNELFALIIAENVLELAARMEAVGAVAPTVDNFGTYPHGPRVGYTFRDGKDPFVSVNRYDSNQAKQQRDHLPIG